VTKLEREMSRRKQNAEAEMRVQTLPGKEKMTPGVVSRRRIVLVAGEGLSGGEPGAAYWRGLPLGAGSNLLLFEASNVQIESGNSETITPRVSSRRLRVLVAGEGFEPSTFGL
jgi:hypothetical protein